MPTRLRPPLDRDLQFFFKHQRDPVANRMSGFSAKDPNDRETFVAHWRKQLQDPSVIARTIECDRAVVGYVASFLRGDAREVSYWLNRGHWGKGIATSALAAFLRDEETRRPLFGRCAVDNVASRRVMEKCGFVVVATERAFANARGEEIEEFVLRLA